MTYELAKELKDAGYQQQLWTGQSFYFEGSDNAVLSDRFQENENVSNKIKIPSLSELIEVCEGGKRYFELIHGMGTGHGWIAKCRVEQSRICPG